MQLHCHTLQLCPATDYISEYVKSTQNEYISKKNIEMSILKLLILSSLYLQ